MEVSGPGPGWTVLFFEFGGGVVSGGRVWIAICNLGGGLVRVGEGWGFWGCGLL